VKNTVVLHSIKVISFILGYPGVLSLVRSLSTSFNRHASGVYGIWFNFGRGLSALWFFVCLGLFAYSIWQTKSPHSKALPHRKVDVIVLLLLGGVGVFSAVHTLIGGFSTSLYTAVILLPIATYSLSILVFGELLARLRDKTLMSTLYWFAFFKAYPVWRPIGFFSLLLLASQLYLLIYYFATPIRIFSLFTICTLSYFAAFLLNLAKDYDKANVEKVRAERFKSELITNVSHDIKTPLTSIISYVDLLKNENLQGQAAEHLQVLDRKSARLKLLIDDLMEASKAGTGNIKVDMKEIDLSEIVGQAAGEFEGSFNDKGLILVMRQHEEPILFMTDSRHLYRVLENLLSNAAKYALAGTRVFVETALRDNRPHITIQNTSASPIDLTEGEVTEQFMRGDKSRQTEGSGLGLYIAKSLIDLIGGKLFIHISGDLFRVDLFL